jgi:hypothetical protein
VLHLVDLVIDTFEYPFGNPGQYHHPFEPLPPPNSPRYGTLTFYDMLCCRHAWR